METIRAIVKESGRIIEVRKEWFNQTDVFAFAEVETGRQWYPEELDFIVNYEQLKRIMS